MGKIIKIIKTDELAGLPLEERLELVEAIWDSIEADAGDLPVPDWHREELDRRLAVHASEPGAGEAWAVVRERLLRALPHKS